MTKVSIIGAGNVGATLAMRVAEADLADVALLDIAEGVCAGKAMDLTDAAPIAGHERKVIGTKDYKDIIGSEIVVITAGFPRAPGMSREELFLKNSSIVKEAAGNIRRLCPDAIIIVVTNPLDAMTYLAYKESGFPKNRVMGMAGVLDASRFIALIADAASVKYKDVETYVLGSHGDTMVPLISHTKIKGKPVTKILSKEKIEELVTRTKNRGAEIVNLLKAGSAYYAPSASAFVMARAIIKNTKEVLCCSCLLEGEYGFKDVCIGVPAKLGKDGIAKIIELSTTDEERKEFEKSAEAVKRTVQGGQI
ncbi:MAG: malate dehydrogenase [Candidatus Omnitrophica bacterium]|nr:malate dehydrogenase [Candidatus Omnitrophota bacterium]